MAKKKRKKGIRNVVYVLAGTSVVTIIAIVIFFYLGANSEETKRYESEVKHESQTFTNGLISELDLIDTSEQGLAAGSTGTTTPTEVPPEIITEAEKKMIGEELTKLQGDARKQKVLQTLSVSYSKVFSKQKAEALSMASRQVEQGKAEWAELVAKGENTAENKAKLASKYLARSEVLEEQIDARFYDLTDKMEQQLIEEGIDPDHIIAGYRAKYENIKEQNKKEMMDKVLAAIQN